MRLMGLALPHDGFILLEEPHASLPGEKEQVAFFDDMKRRMLLQEINNAIADSGSVHRPPRKSHNPSCVLAERETTNKSGYAVNHTVTPRGQRRPGQVFCGRLLCRSRSG